MTGVTVRVNPNSKQQKATRLNDGSWLLYPKAPPRDGKASPKLIGLLAQALGMPKAQVRSKPGHTARTKRVAIDE